MDRIGPFDPDTTSATFGATALSEWSNGNPATGQPGSIPPYEAFSHPLEEIANVIEQAGLVPDKDDLTQLYQAIAAIAGGGGGGGSGVVYATLAEALDSLVTAKAIDPNRLWGVLATLVASETDAGLVRLADLAETQAGSSRVLGVNPANLAAILAGYALKSEGASRVGDIRFNIGPINARDNEFVCQGGSVLKADYPDYDAVFGSTALSVDATNIAVPDLRSLTLVGADNGRGLDASNVLYSYLAGQIGSHTHTIPTSVMVSSAGGNTGGQTTVGNGSSYIYPNNNNYHSTGSTGGTRNTVDRWAGYYYITHSV